jgi:ABC-type transport system substrate-binding protein
MLHRFESLRKTRDDSHPAIAHLGPALFTKYLYFAGAGAPDHPSLILDSRVAVALVDIRWTSLRPETGWPAETYQRYCSADWRGVSLPAGHPVTADPAIRAALNRAVDRQAIVDHVLAGYGRPASTPLSEVYGAAYEPSATFKFNPAATEQLLTTPAGADPPCSASLHMKS